MSPDDARATYSRMLGEFATVIIRRYYGAGSPRSKYETVCAARVMSYQPNEIAGQIVQGDRKVLMLAQDLETGAVALPLLSTDKVVVRGKEMAIEAIDDNTHRIGDTLCAYILQVRG